MKIELIREKNVDLSTTRQWWKVNGKIELMVTTTNEISSVYFPGVEGYKLSAELFLEMIRKAEINGELSGGIDSLFVEIRKEDLEKALKLLS